MQTKQIVTGKVKKHRRWWTIFAEGPSDQVRTRAIFRNTSALDFSDFREVFGR